MIALDTNLLVPCLVKSQPEHVATLAWLRKTREPLATTHTNLGELLRLLTHPRVFPRPMTLMAAVALVHQLIGNFAITLLEESPSWWEDLADLIDQVPGLRGNEVFDARIALCLRHNGVRTIATLDSGFAKYPFLKRVTP